MATATPRRLEKAPDPDAPAEAAPPDTAQQDLRLVTLPDGSELVMLPLTWRMMKISARVQGDGNIDGHALGELMEAIEEATIEARFKNGRPLALQPSDVFRTIYRAWGREEDDHALPPANGQPSAKPSSE